MAEASGPWPGRVEGISSDRRQQSSRAREDLASDSGSVHSEDCRAPAGVLVPLSHGGNITASTFHFTSKGLTLHDADWLSERGHPKLQEKG